MNENKNIPESRIEIACDDCNFVTVPRDEYDDLVAARFGLQLIASSLDKYGADKDIVFAVCKQFGYEYHEEMPDA